MTYLGSQRARLILSYAQQLLRCLRLRAQLGDGGGRCTGCCLHLLLEIKSLALRRIQLLIIGRLQ